MAYPMAFLISPEEAKKEKLKMASEEQKVNETVCDPASKVNQGFLTNLLLPELKEFMTQISAEQVKPNAYILQNGLKVDWYTRGKYCVATLYGCSDAEELQSFGEDYFQTLDAISARNVRLIESSEFFYYNYDIIIFQCLKRLL